MYYEYNSKEYIENCNTERNLKFHFVTFSNRRSCIKPLHVLPTNPFSACRKQSPFLLYLLNSSIVANYVSLITTHFKYNLYNIINYILTMNYKNQCFFNAKIYSSQWCCKRAISSFLYTLPQSWSKSSMKIKRAKPFTINCDRCSAA